MTLFEEKKRAATTTNIIDTRYKLPYKLRNKEDWSKKSKLILEEIMNTIEISTSRNNLEGYNNLKTINFNLLSNQNKFEEGSLKAIDETKSSKGNNFHYKKGKHIKIDLRSLEEENFNNGFLSTKSKNSKPLTIKSKPKKIIDLTTEENSKEFKLTPHNNNTNSSNNVLYTKRNQLKFIRNTSSYKKNDLCIPKFPKVEVNTDSLTLDLPYNEKIKLFKKQNIFLFENTQEENKINYILRTYAENDSIEDGILLE